MCIRDRCSIQLLGPILEGALFPEEFDPTPPAPPTPPPPPPPPPPTQYTFQRYDVDALCTKSNATNVWSYTNYTDGFYNSSSLKYYVSASSHSTFTTEFIGSATTCTPSPTQYTYVRYDVDTQCTQSNATNVWSYNSYTNGLYTISSAKKYLATGSHSTFTTEITSATPTTCTPATLYYRVDSCDVGGGQLYTSLTPSLTNQRYIDSVTLIYYVWDNTTTESPGTIGGNLQLVSGQTNCPI